MLTMINADNDDKDDNDDKYGKDGDGESGCFMKCFQVIKFIL